MDEILRREREYDRRLGFDTFVDPRNREENLKYLLIGLQGEVGEIANDLKKVLRKKRMKGEEIPEGFYEGIKKEVMDAFMYLLKISILLGMDLKREHEELIKENLERFSEYRRD